MRTIHTNESFSESNLRVVCRKHYKWSWRIGMVFDTLLTGAPIKRKWGILHNLECSITLVHKEEWTLEMIISLKSFMFIKWFICDASDNDITWSCHVWLKEMISVTMILLCHENRMRKFSVFSSPCFKWEEKLCNLKTIAIIKFSLWMMNFAKYVIYLQSKFSIFILKTKINFISLHSLKWKCSEFNFKSCVNPNLA